MTRMVTFDSQFARKFVKTARCGDDDSARTAHDGVRIATDQLIELHIAGAPSRPRFRSRAVSPRPRPPP